MLTSGCEAETYQQSKGFCYLGDRLNEKWMDEIIECMELLHGRKLLLKLNDLSEWCKVGDIQPVRHGICGRMR